MSQKGLLIALLLGQVIFARSLPKLSCNISRQADGFFKYGLSKPPPPSWLSSDGCEITWEDANKTAIVYKSAAGFHKDDKLVRNVTDMGIVTNECRKMHYKVECPTRSLFEETFCEVNCSLISVVDPQPTNGAILGNNTICISMSWCVSRLHLLAAIVGICTTLAVLCVMYLVWYRWKRVRFTQQNPAPFCCCVEKGHGERHSDGKDAHSSPLEMVHMMKDHTV